MKKPTPTMQVNARMLVNVLRELLYAAEGLGGTHSESACNRWTNAKADARKILALIETGSDS